MGLSDQFETGENREKGKGEREKERNGRKDGRTPPPANKFLVKTLLVMQSMNFEHSKIWRFCQFSKVL